MCNNLLMITKETINVLNFPELRMATSRKREDAVRQEEALADTKLLREFAMENGLKDEVFELFLEEALIHQHYYMDTHDDIHLVGMKQVVRQAETYLKANDLTHWESRLARFLGRISDYEQKYHIAADFYKEATTKVHIDPKYPNNRAMGFEYEGFLIIDELHLGNTEQAILMAEKLYQNYDKADEGRQLKEKDYTTWAIWRSGLLINLCRTLIKLGKLETYKEKISEWLRLAENDLQPAENIKTWSDFGFRKNEIAKIRESL
ncbi:MAG: hypothetical protein UW68_C0058G0005 [Candidatus Collierbacteria bacterium GW2011_GWB1_44_6]|uniref:Uncharacterized protein n=1 Tax=Candidatus Collierbacteria bacterium GW2011_GWB1_44_6 TaxID=1618384 RepID=A0A0G1JJZ2_9BACT|nr:MAG: hypothetical protein UW68_C0058G0005 [Candidatus Collierbacteria bacterium GW2011_GWB1_44_6]